MRGFLASRGISLPEGTPDDPPGTETVHGLANRKLRALVRRLDDGAVTTFEGARLYLELAHEAGVHTAAVSASANANAARARAPHRARGRADRREHDGEGAPAEQAGDDTLAAACRHLGVVPVRGVVFEATPAGVAAGRAGGFEVVVGVAGTGGGERLRARRADRVVADLGEIVEQRSPPDAARRRCR